MRRRAFLSLLGGAAAWPGVAGAQHKQVPRLCFLTFDPGTLRTRSSRLDGSFRAYRISDMKMGAPSTSGTYPPTITMIDFPSSLMNA